MLTAAPSGQQVGFIVPHQLEQVKLKREALFRAPRVLAGCAPRWLAGFAVHEGRILNVVDLSRLADEVATVMKEPEP